MAVSGSFDFSQNRDEAIKDALIEANIIEPSQTPTSPMNEHASRVLNRMLKSMQADGLNLWIVREATLFLQEDKIKYLLGPSGDHCTESPNETAIKTAASSSATSIDVDTTTGMTASDNILLEMDDGTMHVTTISSVTDSDTVVLTTGTDDTAAVDNVVYWYTTKIQRPERILNATYRQYSTGEKTDIPMDIISRSEYWELGGKTAEGTPTILYFDPQLTNAEIRVFNEPDDVKDTIILMCQFPFDDMDAATDDFAFPKYWQNAIHYEFSYRLTRSYGAPQAIQNSIRTEADREKDRALDFDTEMASMYISPDHRE